MQHDEVIWQLIMHGHCSFRAKTKTQNFCRNENNVTGLCNRSSCPLANSRYATIKEEGGRCYLFLKTIERAHTPKNMWQKIRLKRQYAAALAQLDEHLAHWPKFLVHKNKQRLTKITQYLIRMRRLAVKARPKLVTMPARKEKQLKRKEAKAETAAQLEKSIERELLARLQSGTYGDIYNFPMKQYEKVLNREEVDEEEEAEGVAAEEEEEAEEEVEEEVDEYVEGDEESEEEGEEVEWVDDAEVEFSDEDLEDFSGGEGSSEEEAAGDSEEEGSEEDAGPSSTRPAGGKPAGGGTGAAGKRKGAAAEAKPEAGGKRGAKPEAKRRRRGRMEIEYEEEREDLRSTR